MNKTKEPENKAYKVTLILLVGLAGFSTAVKDLNRLGDMVSGIQEFTSQWQGTDLVVINDKALSTPISINDSCSNDSRPLVGSSVESSASDRIAAAADIEVENFYYDTIIEPEVGGEVGPVTGRKVNRHISHLARAKYAPAKTLKEEISAKRRDGHWPAHFEFKTNDRIVTLDLPITMLTDIKSDAFEAEVSPDFPSNLLVRTNRKQLHGKTDNSRREFMIKRFERSFTSRRAS